MQKWTRKAAAVIAVICLAFGTAGVAMHKWDEMRQEKAHEELTAQVVGMSEAGTTGETMPEKKVPEVENEIGETNAIKETEYVSAIDFSALDSQNPDPFYADLEKEMLEKVNKLGIGPQGFGGKTTAIGLNIETMPTHIAGMPCAVNINCHVTRHKTEVL